MFHDEAINHTRRSMIDLEMDLEKRVFTTFEAAEICHANITSIKNWIDQGKLRAFRTPGGHYRIERTVLEDFLNRHGMPNPFARRQRRRVLLIHRNVGLLEELRGRFGSGHDYDGTGDVVDALLKIGQWKPDVAVVDGEVEELDAAGLCERVREHSDLNRVKLIVLCGGDAEESARLRQIGADFTVPREAGVGAILEAVRRALL